MTIKLSKTQQLEIILSQCSFLPKVSDNDIVHSLDIQCPNEKMAKELKHVFKSIEVEASHSGIGGISVGPFDLEKILKLNVTNLGFVRLQKATGIEPDKSWTEKA